jgi:protein phosphatase
MTELLSNQDFLPPKEKPLTITIGYSSIPEKSGELNGDTSLLGDGFFGVFDGTSDSQNDSKASIFAKDEVDRFLSDPKEKPRSLEDAKDLVNEALNETHLSLFALGEKDNEKLNTTASIGLIFKPKDSQPRMIIGNCGDSRVYLFDGKLGQITLDDGVVRSQNKKDLQKAFQIQSEISDLDQPSNNGSLDVYYQYRNAVFNCLGAKDIKKNKEEILEPRIIDFKIEPGDLFLFCSDGLTDNVTTKDMEEFFQQDLTPQAIADSLIFRAKQKSLDKDSFRHKPDDITALVVKINYQK